MNAQHPTSNKDLAVAPWFLIPGVCHINPEPRVNGVGVTGSTVKMIVAANLFGAGIRPTEEADKRRLTQELYKDRKKMRALLYGALETAGSRCAHTNNAVAMGYCFGGTAILELARSGADLKGFISFHGGLETPPGQDYSKTKGKLLILHGTADTFVTMDQFAKLAEELEANKIPHEMTTYGGAPHAFTVFGSDRYRKDADEKSWKRLMDFLKETLE